MLTNVHRNVFGIFIVSVFLGEIQGHLQKRIVDSSIEHAGTSSRRAIRTRAIDDSDGRIIFPTDLSTSTTPPPSVNPCGNLPYCENPSSYPSEFIKNALKEHPNMQILASIGETVEIAQRIESNADEKPLCEAEAVLIHPKAGQNVENQTLYIVNEEGFKQAVTVQECKAQSTRCDAITGFTTGVHTFCKQMYAYKPMTAVMLNGSGLGIDIFRFPSSCCCSFIEGNPSERFGGDEAVRPRTQLP